MKEINRKAQFLCIILFAASFVKAQTDVSSIADPLAVIQLVGDKLVRDTPFKYKLDVVTPAKNLNNLQSIDFGQVFGLGKAGVAYAYTCMEVPEDAAFEIQLEHNDGCKIWLNGQMVYERKGSRKINLQFEERSVELAFTCTLPLKKGNNELLVKSETSGDEWCIYLQPPTIKGAVVLQPKAYPKIGLTNNKHISSKIADISNWLVIGPFANPESGSERTGIDTVYAPEREISFGNMYAGTESPITWTIPKPAVFGAMIDPNSWGTNYLWSYHTGGVAWAMQCLSEVTGNGKYAAYAADYCEFQLKSIPFVAYQIETLHVFNVPNKGLYRTPLLDFTLAPALPFIYKLHTQKQFPGRELYVDFINKMNRYARTEQIRLPDLNIYTRTTPVKYTTWVDDMFMGIPYLVQAALYADNEKDKKVFLDDAASQVLGFNTQVWDADAQLYMHARHSGDGVKFPHWSRANGWGIWAVTEVLSHLPEKHPQYKAILKHYRQHVDALIKLQDSSGFWFNVLDRPDSPKEVSGTAIFTMAIARGVVNGWLPAKKYAPAAQKGWAAVKTRIEPDGTIHDICGGTNCSSDVAYYMNRPLYDNDTHGLFAVLFAGIEMNRMLEKGK